MSRLPVLPSRARALLLGTALAFAAVAPADLRAQDPDDDDWPGDVRVRVFRGPMLGLMLAPDDDADSARRGARVERVIPDSPADDAGIRGGDVITRFNTTSLTDERRPSRRLRELARELEPGDTVRLEYRRDGETRTATVVAREVGAARAFAFRVPPMAAIEPHLDHLRRRIGFDRAWHGLELADLNPRLGEYFGTKEGALVLDTRSDSLPLRPGDVILRIDGRAPQDAAHAERILGSYRPGEQVKVEIMRKQKRETVTWTVPERGRDRENVRRWERGRMMRGTSL